MKMIPLLRDSLNWEKVRHHARQVLRRYRARRCLAALDTPVKREMIEKAAIIEPAIHLPRGRRKVSWPPRVHDCRTLFRKGRLLQRLLAGEPWPVVALTSKAPGEQDRERLAAALEEMSRVAGEPYPDHAGNVEGILIVNTDIPGRSRRFFARRDGHVAEFDFAGAVPPRIREKFRSLLLLDVLSGVRARRILVMDSELAWILLGEYARQMSQWADIYVCLSGAEGPETELALHERLENALSSLAGILCLTPQARRELIVRFRLPSRVCVSGTALSMRRSLYRQLTHVRPRQAISRSSVLDRQ